jgi:hypothetical protein
MKIDNERQVAPFRRSRGNVNNGGPCTIEMFQRDHVIATGQKSPYADLSPRPPTKPVIRLSP